MEELSPEGDKSKLRKLEVRLYFKMSFMSEFKLQVFKTFKLDEINYKYFYLKTLKLYSNIYGRQSKTEQGIQCKQILLSTEYQIILNKISGIYKSKLLPGCATGKSHMFPPLQVT